jgi:cyclase
MIHRRELLRTSLGTAGALWLGGYSRGQDPKDDSDPAPLIAKIGPTLSKVPITVANLATGLDLIQGPGGNVAVLRGPDGLLVVDSGIPVRAMEVLETVKRVGGKAVSTLIDTHWHFDHAGGNEVFARAGATIVATETTRTRLSTDQYTTVFKMTTPASPPVALPVLTFDEANLRCGDETIHLFAVPPAHTDGDLVVHFTGRDVIHTGDLFSNGFYPNIDASSRGWIGGMIAAADRILKIAGPKTKVIPGHGPLGTAADLAAFRKMLITIHDRLAPMADAGKTIEEAIAAKPTKDLDPTWAKGFFNGGIFTRIAYDGVLKHRAEG